MKITVLVENTTRIDKYFLGEPALSLYIEVDGLSILFDCGYSNLFLANAQKLNINLNTLNYIIISHGHNDHTGGLRYLSPNKSTKLIAHPNIFDFKSDKDGEYGCPISRQELEYKYSTILTTKEYKINENLYFLGQINNNPSEDIEDSALVYKTSKGLFIITGCSHAGIHNIIKQAQEITGIKNIYGIIGGLHLINKPISELEQIAQNLKDVNVIYPCHCCDLTSKIELSKICNIKEVCTGDQINI